METNILEDIGLSKNERKVYLALLELGSTTATPLVRKAGIPNSKIYPTIDRLMDKGLVSFIVRNKRKWFSASDPRNLLEYLNDKEKTIEKQKESVNELLPNFLAMQKEGKGKQEAHVFVGREGMTAIFRDLWNTLKKGDKYYVIYCGEYDFYDKMKVYFRNIHLRREKLGIHVNMVQNSGLKPIVDFVSKGMKLYNTRFYNDALPTSWTMIYADNVVSVTVTDDITAFVIKSKPHADQYIQFFKTLWEKATP